MARRAKGKQLTLRPVRLDDDVWATCLRLGKVHGTINAGLRVGLGMDEPDTGTPVTVEEVAQRSNSPRPKAAGYARREIRPKGDAKR